MRSSQQHTSSERAALHPAEQPTTMGQRLRAEWQLLVELIRLNPARLRDPRQRDTTFFVTLLETPGLLVGADLSHAVREHHLRILYPLHFPALPMEAYLTAPVFHPNIHPETGFLCLWDRHASTNTIEHALHKAAAMLGWQLLTTDQQHVMQSEAALVTQDREQLAAMRARLNAPALLGIEHHDSYSSTGDTVSRRRRLS